MGKRSWAGSLVLHALVLVAALLLWRPAAMPPEVMRWDVALLAPAVESAPLPEPPMPRPSVTRAPPPPAMPRTAPDPRPEPVTAQPVPRPEPAPVAPPVVSPAAPPATTVSAEPTPPAEASEKPSAKPAPVASPPPQAAASERIVEKPAVPRADPEAQRRWYAALAARLAELKRYPMLARRLGQEGVVVLEAEFRGGGASARIKRGSGHGALDRAALKLFEEAVSTLEGKLTPPEGGLLEIPVAYRLES